MRLFTLVPLLVVFAVSSSPGESPANSLLANADLEGGGLGGADGWPTVKGVSVEEEDGNHFLRLQAGEPGQQIQAYRKVNLPGGVQKLAVRFRVRFTDITAGAENWHTGRVVMHFKDASGQLLKPDPAPFAFKGNSNGWMDKEVTLTVPEGAVMMEFMPALFQVAQGTLDVDDVVIVPADS